VALQLANFWQDLSVDVARGRLYAPLADLQRHGVDADAMLRGADTPAVRALIAELVQWARGLMTRGAPLVHQVPGRVGWELRLVVQGGLRILEKIERGSFATMRVRPVITAADAPRMLWRALWMRRSSTSLRQGLA
jgi:hydroxysqualene synthase